MVLLHKETDEMLDLLCVCFSILHCFSVQIFEIQMTLLEQLRPIEMVSFIGF